MTLKHLLFAIVIFSIVSCKSDYKIERERPISKIKITPIEHASLILEHKDTIIYIDPTGGKDAYIGLPKPHYVIITDSHSDHFHLKTLEALDLKNAVLIAPKVITDTLPTTIAKTIVTLNNGENFKLNSFSVDAIPMYNLRKDAIKFHPKGRGNGYVLTLGNQRVYISGDTEDIPEMRNLKNIDIAFICMNLPYTMTVESAADAVLSFTPNQVYPYHYRGTQGYSDVYKFKALVNQSNTAIEVVQLEWYPNDNHEPLDVNDKQVNAIIK